MLIDRIPDDTISSEYALAILEILSDFGFAEEAVLQCLETSLDALDSPKTRIPASRLITLFDEAQAQLSRPCIGLEVGFQFRISTFSESGSALSHSRTLRDAARMNARYTPLAETMGRRSLYDLGTDVGLEWVPVSNAHDERRHITELVFGGCAATVFWMCWGFEADAGPVTFQHACPDDDALATYKRVFRVVPQFGSDANRFAFPEGTSDLELPTYSPRKLAMVRERLDEILFDASADESAASLRLQLSRNLEHGVTTSAQFAESLNIDPRELSNRLEAVGLSFRTLLEEARKDRFQTLHANGNALSDIAISLGYNDQAAFTRAFRRWYGVTPGRYAAPD